MLEHAKIPDLTTYSGQHEALQRLGYVPYTAPLWRNDTEAVAGGWRTAMQRLRSDVGDESVRSVVERFYADALGVEAQFATPDDCVWAIRSLGVFEGPDYVVWHCWAAQFPNASFPKIAGYLADAVVRNTLAANKGERTMTTVTTAPPHQNSGIVEATKKAISSGIQIGIGGQALRLAVRGTLQMLGKAGVPKEVLKLPIVRTVITLGAPTMLRLVAGKIPGLSHPRVIGVLDLAQTAAFAAVTADAIALIVKQTGPLVKGLVALGESLQLEDGKDQDKPCVVQAAPASVRIHAGAGGSGVA